NSSASRCPPARPATAWPPRWPARIRPTSRERAKPLSSAAAGDREVLGLGGPSEKVTLDQIAARGGEERELLGRLDALGDDLEAEVMAERDDRAGDQRALAIDVDLVDERAVDLERVDLEAAEVGERRVAGAEVVDRDAHALGAQRADHRLHLRGVAHQHALGELELEAAPGKAVVAEAVRDAVDQSGPLELARRQVHRDPELRPARGPPGRQLLARARQHPLADRDDPAVLLEQRDELPRRNDGPARPVPAQQRLVGHHALTIDGELGLEVQPELAALERVLAVVD